MMRAVLIFLTLTLLLLGGSTDYADAQEVDIKAFVKSEAIRDFYSAIEEYYKIPQVDIMFIKSRHAVEDQEIPVVFFIARRVHVAPARVIDMRRRKKSWLDIMSYFGLNPAILYVPLKEELKELKRPPYGKIYSYYKKRPRKEWKNIMLNDSDVINLVNLNFLSEYHSCAPEEIVKLRTKRRSFVAINSDIKKGKLEKPEEGKEKRGKRRGGRRR